MNKKTLLEKVALEEDLREMDSKTIAINLTSYWYDITQLRKGEILKHLIARYGKKEEDVLWEFFNKASCIRSYDKTKFGVVKDYPFTNELIKLMSVCDVDKLVKLGEDRMITSIFSDNTLNELLIESESASIKERLIKIIDNYYNNNGELEKDSNISSETVGSDTLTRLYLKKTLSIFKKRTDAPNDLLKKYFFTVDEELKSKMEKLDDIDHAIKRIELKDQQKREIKLRSWLLNAMEADYVRSEESFIKCYKNGAVDGDSKEEVLLRKVKTFFEV